MLDGILLNLSIKSQAKPASVQNRILRRIVEKRQAQANHKKYGRTEDLTSVHVSITSTSRCMETIRKKGLQYRLTEGHVLVPNTEELVHFGKS